MSKQRFSRFLSASCREHRLVGQLNESRNTGHLKDKSQIWGGSGQSNGFQPPHGSKMVVFTNKKIRPLECSTHRGLEPSSSCHGIDHYCGGRGIGCGESSRSRDQEIKKNLRAVFSHRYLPNWSEPSKQRECSGHPVGRHRIKSPARVVKDWIRVAKAPRP